MPSIFFYLAGLGFTSGIFIRSFFNVGWAEVFFCIVVGAACGVAGWQRKTEGFPLPLILTSIAFIACALGMARMHSVEIAPSELSVSVDAPVSLITRVAHEPEVRETSLHLYVEVEQTNQELILVKVDRFAYATNDISYGDTVRVVGKLVQPEAFATDGGRMFDYPGYLRARGVSFVIDHAKLEVLTQEEGTFFGYLFRGKKLFQETLERIIPEPYAGLGEGVLLGVKRALGENLEETFRRTGIIHIVVLSGYNIMIVVECIMWALAFFFFPRTRMLLGIGAIILFALLVGLSATVVRAALMAVLLIVARTTGRTYAVLRALMLAGMGMLIFNPYLLVHDPGFQLSFLATLGLILVVPHIEVRLVRVTEMFGIRSILAATLATQLFVLPILLYHMGTLSLVSVLVNVLVLPAVPLAMLLTFATGVFGLIFTPLGYGVGFLAYLSLGYIVYVAQLFDALPFASFTVDAFPFWIVFAVYIVYGIGLLYLYNRETTAKTPEEVRGSDDFSDWSFIDGDADENKVSPEARSASGETHVPFPFR